jgi:hypothetical protein
MDFVRADGGTEQARTEGQCAVVHYTGDSQAG